jgi:hypothetical protein
VAAVFLDVAVFFWWRILFADPSDGAVVSKFDLGVPKRGNLPLFRAI